ncbi:unnamed protein product [Adineta ricciae]|uniref:G-protein coupled receptors family 1 profile domain-containing protein n=1 Tax=Adineta ricciae TaxID=249248 RepID=A0A814WNC7_ADIRI|nr:unnamed protein product [Adineta ricciae]
MTINCYFSIFLLIFGVVGNLLNLLVLSQRSLRSNACAWLFLISSVFNLISLLTGLPTRVLSSWTIVVTDEVEWLCRLRVFLVLTSRTTAAWLIVFATFDRWLLSCRHTHYRRLSKLRNAQRAMICILFLSCFIYSPIFYCYQANLRNTPLKCYSQTTMCRIISDQIYLCFTVLVPTIFMIFFSLLTLSNVRRMHHRLQMPFLSELTQTMIRKRRRFRLLDRHLLVMLLVQIGFFILFTFPQGIEMIYLTITRNDFKSTFQLTIENAIFTFTLSLTYLASGMPFYVYTISGGRAFQQALLKFITRFIVN